MVTVAICTYNRAKLLGLSLEAVLKQEADFAFDVLVVDNNSTDNTREVTESFMRSSPLVSYVLEEKQGLSHARNRALVEATSSIVAYLDDDAVARPGWLTAITRAFGEPGVDCAGGKIVLKYPCAKPDWLDERMESILSAYDKGEQPKDVPEVFGANFAVRREAALKLGGFSDKVGCLAGRSLGGEETDMCRRIRSSGSRVLYVPDAVVDHLVDPNRLNKDWLVKRYELNGRASVILAEKEIWTSREIIRYLVLSAIAFAYAILGRQKQSIWHAVRAAVSKGILEERYPTTLNKMTIPAAFIAELPKALIRAAKLIANQFSR